MPESKGEKRCREYFENKFGKPFIKCRPEWLINPSTKRKLELDGYNEKLKLAFEYNGNQHYEYIEYFHNNNVDNFLDQIQRDVDKRLICANHGIRLIIIPNISDEIIDNFLNLEFQNPKSKCFQGCCVII